MTVTWNGRWSMVRVRARQQGPAVFISYGTLSNGDTVPVLVKLANGLFAYLVSDPHRALTPRLD